MMGTTSTLRDRAKQAITAAAGDRRRQIMDRLTVELGDVVKRRAMTRNQTTDQDVYVAALAVVLHYEEAFLADGDATHGGPNR